MFNYLTTDLNKTSELPPACPAASSDAERAKGPLLPEPPDRPYKPFGEEAALGQTPYRPYAEAELPGPAYQPYAEKDQLPGPAYEPYKGV